MDDIMGRTHYQSRKTEKRGGKWKYRTKSNSLLLYQNHISAQPLTCDCKDPVPSSQPCLVLTRAIWQNMKAFVHERFFFLY